MMSFENSWRVVNAVRVPETLRLLMSGTLMQEVRSKGEDDNNNTYLCVRRRVSAVHSDRDKPMFR